MTIYSMAEDRQNNETGGRAMGAVMNCIGVLLALIGSANALSSVSGSMHQRRKEFAMLRSVGMDSYRDFLDHLFKGASLWENGRIYRHHYGGTGGDLTGFLHGGFREIPSLTHFGMRRSE